jgi:hypothetical protein
MAQKEGSGVPRTPVIVSGGGEGSEEETASSPGGGSMFGSSASGTPTRGEGSGAGGMLRSRPEPFRTNRH